jgi:hypothetical protein
MTSNNRLEEDEVVPLSSFIMLRDKNIPSFPYWAMPVGKDPIYIKVTMRAHPQEVQGK